MKQTINIWIKNMTVVNDNRSKTTWLFVNSKLQRDRPIKKDASSAPSKVSKHEMAPILAALRKGENLFALRCSGFSENC